MKYVPGWDQIVKKGKKKKEILSKNTHGWVDPACSAGGKRWTSKAVLDIWRPCIDSINANYHAKGKFLATTAQYSQGIMQLEHDRSQVKKKKKKKLDNKEGKKIFLGPVVPSRPKFNNTAISLYTQTSIWLLLNSYCIPLYTKHFKKCNQLSVHHTL